MTHYGRSISAQFEDEEKRITDRMRALVESVSPNHAGDAFAYMIYGADPRECSCPRCRGKSCSCPNGRPPCGVCVESCDPDDPTTRILVDACDRCGCFECGCYRKPPA